MIQKKISIKNKLGLHARAASKLVSIAQAYVSEIDISVADKKANGKSIMSLLVLGAPCDSELLLRVNGEDETEAVDAITALINNLFDEGE